MEAKINESRISFISQITQKLMLLASGIFKINVFLLEREIYRQKKRLKDLPLIGSLPKQPQDQS